MRTGLKNVNKKNRESKEDRGEDSEGEAEGKPEFSIADTRSKCW